MNRRDVLRVALASASVTLESCRKRAPARPSLVPSLEAAWIAFGGVAGGEVESDGTSALLSGVATRLARLSTVTRTVVAEVALDAADRIRALAYGEGALWATTASGAVLQIDPETLAIRTRTALGHVGAVAAGVGAVWVGGQWGQHVSSDSRSSRLVPTLPPEDRKVLHRIDAKTGAHVAAIPLGFVPSYIATCGRGVWAASEESEVSAPALAEVDPVAGAVAHRIALDVDVMHLTASADAVYATTQMGFFTNGPVLKVDPETRHVDRLPVGGGEHKTMRVVAARGALWISGEKHEPLIRLDLTNGEVTVVRKTPYGTEIPMELASNADGVWAAAWDADRVFHVDVNGSVVDAAITLARPVCIAAA